MLDFVRVATRIAVITVIVSSVVALIILLGSVMQSIPFPDLSPLTKGFSFAFWFLNKFAPPLVWTFGFIGALIAFKVSVYLAYLANLTASWVLEIFQ